MERNVIIAIVLSLGIILLYPYFLDMVSPEAEKQAIETTAPAQTGRAGEAASGSTDRPGSAETAEAQKIPAFKPVAAGVPITVTTPLVRATLTTDGGGVTSWELTKYRLKREGNSGAIDLSETVGAGRTLATVVRDGADGPVEFAASARSLDVVKGETAELFMTGTTPAGLKVSRRYTFSGDTYLVGNDLTITNTSEKTVKATVVTPVEANVAGDDDYGYHTGPLVRSGEEVSRIDDQKRVAGSKATWVGTENKYFLAAVIPGEGAGDAAWEAEVLSESSSRAAMNVPIELAPGESVTFSYGTFLGPKEYNLLNRLEGGLVESIEFGYMSFLAKPMLVVLNFFERYVANYGLAIILLTILIKILFYPLTKHSLTSMKEMQRLQPQLEAIKKKYKENKDKLNKEIMDLYKRNKINPVSGCLPMILQIPVFIGLYEALYVAIELRHAPFALWITDLSAKDPYYITPLLMGATMFLQQKMSPTPMGDPTQKKMMMFMPVIFTVMFLSFPSGLVLYWLVNNVLTIGQTYMIHRSAKA